MVAPVSIDILAFSLGEFVRYRIEKTVGNETHMIVTPPAPVMESELEPEIWKLWRPLLIYNMF